MMQLQQLPYCASRYGNYTDGPSYFTDTSDLMVSKAEKGSALVLLKEVLNLLVQAIPIGMIFNLSEIEEEPDLLIVLEKSCTRPYHDFESIIELSMLGFASCTCTVHNYGLLNAQLMKGHLFYSSACVDGNLIYRKNGQQQFSEPNQSLVAMAKEEAMVLFQVFLQRAMNFYEGAQYYRNKGCLEMAMFMLHQSCELSYRCALQTLRGKDLKCHSPAVLRKHIRRFAPEMIGVFAENEQEELYYLQLLEDAYIQSRYELHYVVDQEELDFLYQKVALLQAKVQDIGERI